MHRSKGALLRRRIWASRYLYLMFLPVFLYYVIFRYAPMLGLSIAFKDFNAFLGFEKSPWVGFKYFRQFFNSIYLWRLLRNTLLINLYDLLFNFPASIILALLLNEVQNRRFKKVTQTITYLPYFVSSVVIASMVVQFLSPSSCGRTSAGIPSSSWLPSAESTASCTKPAWWTAADTSAGCGISRCPGLPEPSWCC